MVRVPLYAAVEQLREKQNGGGGEGGAGGCGQCCLGVLKRVGLASICRPVCV